MIAFFTSKLGMGVLLAAVIAAALFGFRQASINAGRRLERMKQQERRLKAVRNRREIDEEIQALDISGLRDRGGRWVRGHDG